MGRTMTTKIPVAQLFERISYETALYGLVSVIYDKAPGGTETYYIPEESDGFGFVNSIETQQTYTPEISVLQEITLMPRKLTFSISYHGDTPQEYWQKRQEISNMFSPSARITPAGTPLV